MNRQVFMQVIVPLLGVNRTAVVGISTPDKEDNYYSILLEVKGEDGLPLFKSIKIGLSCDDCIERGVAAQCPHKSNSLPPWKSQNRQDKIKRIMQAHMATFIREALGRINSDTEHVFASFLPALREAPRYTIKAKPRRIDIGIDPSGAGPSEYSIVSSIFEEGRRVVSLRVCVCMKVVTIRTKRPSRGGQTHQGLASKCPWAFLQGGDLWRGTRRMQCTQSTTVFLQRETMLCSVASLEDNVSQPFAQIPCRRSDI